MSMENWTNERFAAYLLRVAADYEELGSEGTAEDYRQAAKRINEIVYLEQEAYEAGMQDAATGLRF